MIQSPSLFALVAVLLAPLATSGCATQQPVDVYLTGIEPMQSTLFEQRARLKLRFQNLSETPLEVSGVDLRLIVNDRQLARGVDDAAFAIAPLSDATSSVVVSSGLFDAVRQLLALPNRQTFSYSLKGKLYTRGLNKRFNRSGEISRKDLQALAPGQPSGR